MKFRYLLFLMICSVSTFAQGGYKINFKIKGWKDFPVFLGHYNGEQILLKDTANVNSNGEFFFDAKNKLPHGVFFLVLKKEKGNVKIFDFVVSDDQFFTLETDTGDYVQHLKVTGDDDNKLYVENVFYSIERNKEDQKKEARQRLNKINDKVLAHQKELISKYPKTMTARMLKATQMISIPDPPKLSNGKIDSTFQFKYYRQHFFDNFDLSDDALLR